MTHGPARSRASTAACATAARERRARRASATLCLLIVVALGWGLHRYTLGFSTWTFEGRRHAQLASGALRAAPVALRAADGGTAPLWTAGAPGHVYLVDFVYTRCPGVCRTLGSEYQRMQRALERDPAARAVRLVSVSFDVAHDTPARLAAHAGELGADPRRWTFAVPGSERDAAALLRSLGVVVVPDGQGGFVHNGAIHLLDAQGRLRGLYEVEQWTQALDDARRLAAHAGADDARRVAAAEGTS